jgi:hypothetical protein
MCYMLACIKNHRFPANIAPPSILSRFLNLLVTVIILQFIPYIR